MHDAIRKHVASFTKLSSLVLQTGFIRQKIMIFVFGLVYHCVTFYLHYINGRTMLRRPFCCFCSLDTSLSEAKDENQNVTDRRAASPYTNDNSKWVEVTGAVTRDAVNNVDGLSVLPVDDVETNEELALQIAMDPTVETSKEFDEKRALQKAKLLSRLRNESDVDIADIPASANGFPAKMEGMRETDDRQDDVFIVELEKGDDGIGLGLIDGLVRVVILFVSAGQVRRVGRIYWIATVMQLPTLDTAYLFSRAFRQL